MPAFSTEELLLASKVYEIAELNRRKACEADAIADGLHPTDTSGWVEAWLDNNPMDEFLDSALQKIVDVAAFIDRRQNRP